MKKTLRIALLVLFLSFQYGFSQTTDELNKFRLAQILSQQGDYENAIELFEQLYRANPDNYPYFDGLRNCYLQVKQYEKAVALLQGRLQTHPSDINLMAMLGNIYYKAGKDTIAYALWEKTIQVDPKNANLYRVVTNFLIENRSFDKAVELLLRGRKTIGDPNLFVTDLATVYAFTMDFKAATKEYLKLLKQDPNQLSYVQMRLVAFTERQEGLRAATEVVKEEAESNGDNISIQSLLAWLCFEAKNYEDAYAVDEAIDKLRGSSGAEIFGFAERAFREKAYEIASRAYKEVVDNYPKLPVLPNARFGYARSIEEFANLKSGLDVEATVTQPSSNSQYPATEAIPRYQGAISVYEELAQQYPLTGWFAEAWYRVGIIKFERFFDLHGALAAFEQVLKQSLQGNVSLDAAIKMGDVSVAQGKLSDAREKYQTVLSLPATANEYKDKVRFKLADIDYLEGKFDDALSKLEEITKNPSADYTNDALALQLFVQDNRMPEAALKEFAQGELCIHQRKISEAIVIFEDIWRSFPVSTLVDESLMKIGELQNQIQQYPQALAAYQELIDKYHESMWVDKAQMSVAETYQFKLKDRQKALALYERLLKDYPNSVYVAEARKRIRELRGDNL